MIALHHWRDNGVESTDTRIAARVDCAARQLGLRTHGTVRTHRMLVSGQKQK
jgi:hypothetical protein